MQIFQFRQLYQVLYFEPYVYKQSQLFDLMTVKTIDYSSLVDDMHKQHS